MVVSAQALVLKVSEAACGLAEQLGRREQLQRSELFPEPMQVECRRHDCVGIGYLGFELIMCMICTEQWPAAAEEEVHHAGRLDEEAKSYEKAYAEMKAMPKDGPPVRIRGNREMRMCPKCGAVTEKNGGCDHMRCAMCKHEYYWSTGKAYR